MLFKDGLQVSTASVKAGTRAATRLIGATLEIDAWTPQWSLLAGLARGRAALLRGTAFVSDPVREP
jgi:hypothetical protein